jgi:HlyD family secretion protein
MTKKKLTVIASIIGVIVIGGFILKPFSGNGEEGSFEFTEINRGNLENTVSSTGTLSALETVEVGSQVSGIIDKLYVDFNAPVKKGQLLAVLDKTLFEVSIRDAEALVARAKAKLDQAKAEVDRNLPLFEKGHLSEMEFLVTKTTARTAEADLETAQAALNRARTQLDYTEIRSPIDGTIIERTVDAGQTIAASFQAPKLFTIARDLNQMQIEVSVDESDIGSIKEGQKARFTVQAYPDEMFEGTVRQVRLKPTTIQNVVNYTVVVDASNKDGKLLPGMTATVDFVVEEKRDVLLVSNAALNFKPTEDQLKKMAVHMPAKTMPAHALGQGSMENIKDMGTVYFLDNSGALRMMPVRKGTTDGTHTEIFEGKGIKEGLQVITAYSTEKKSKTKEPAFTMPRPPAGGGMRRGI